MGPGLRWALGGAAAVASVGGVLAYARTRSEEPARCAPGMIALGVRCCGEGQRLERGGDGDRCAGAPSRCSSGMQATPRGCVAPQRRVHLAGGTLRVGPGDWEAQGVVAAREASMAPYDLDAIEVTEDAWSACVAAGFCAPLASSGEPGRAQAGMSLDEATAYCAWRGGALPTSDQLAFAAAGTAARRYAWGDTGAVCRRATWGLASGPCGWGARGPELAGSHPDGASPEGALDLAGNVAEWSIGPAGVPEVRGGSYASAEASELRAWNRRAVSAGARSPDVGVRCAYRSTP